MRKPRDLTTRQWEVLKVFAKKIHEPYPPSRRELMEACNMRSPNAIQEYIHLFLSKGYVVTQKHKARAIALTDKTLEAMGGNV